MRPATATRTPAEKGVRMGYSIVGSTKLASRLEQYPRIHRVHQKQQKTLTVTTVLKKQPGGAQSRLVQCDDGKLYVLKMHPNPQGPNVLANEALGSMLMHGLGILAPRWTTVTIGLKAVRLFPDLAMHNAKAESIFPTCGIHFGSEYLGGPQYDLYDFMPETYSHKLRDTAQRLAVYLFDVWASHQDERQCLFQRVRGESLYDIFFIDNGHLFGGPKWSEFAYESRRARSVNTQSPPMRDPRMDQWLNLFESRIPGLLHSAIALVPQAWYEGDIYTLYARLLWRLAAIRSLVDLEILQTTRCW
jgi:hypothetical protein